MQFIYVLPGWEGSAADGRVLRDALLRPHGLKVPRPCYYLEQALKESLPNSGILGKPHIESRIKTMKKD